MATYAPHLFGQIMEQSSVIFRALMQFREQDPATCAKVWGDPELMTA